MCSDDLPRISDIDTGIFIKTCLAQYFYIKDKQPVELRLVVTAIAKAYHLVANGWDQLKSLVRRDVQLGYLRHPERVVAQECAQLPHLYDKQAITSMDPDLCLRIIREYRQFSGKPVGQRQLYAA